jgi:hypothetical protein
VRVTLIPLRPHRGPKLYIEFCIIGQELKLDTGLYQRKLRAVDPDAIRRIRMFLDLPDPDPSLFVRIRIFPSSSKNSNKNLDFLLFFDFFMTFYL